MSNPLGEVTRSPELEPWEKRADRNIELAQLRRELARAKDDAESTTRGWFDAIEAWAEERARHTEEIEHLRGALKPFAEVAAMADSDVPDDAIACALLGDFRRAAALCK